MKIILSGGGTLGPVVPLLAIAEKYKKYDSSVEFLWIGTKNGPEKKLIDENGIPFVAIGAGKWRRYFSILNITDIFKLMVAFFQSLIFLIKEKPDLLISAGGYVSVPLHWAATLLAMPQWVHQQDIEVGLANKLMMPFASKITTATEDTINKLPNRHTEWIGNPSRDLTVLDKKVSRKKFGIPENSPVIFALGGGTGSISINQLILAAVPQLNSNWHVIHLTGRDRPGELSEKAAEVFNNYHVYEFFTEEMKDAYALADVVVARAGFSTLTELAALSKPAIILPMFGTHQEENAKTFAEKGGIIMLGKSTSNGLRAAQIIKELIESEEKRKELGKNLNRILPSTKDEKIVQIIKSLTKKPA